MSETGVDPRLLAREAYVYLYPLVTMEMTRRQAVNTPDGQHPGLGAPNEFHHIRTYPPAEDRSVVRLNFDTLYSWSWLDLSAGPVEVHVPDTDGRYYMLPMLDMWTDVFATIGSRTTGNGEGDFVVSWSGAGGDVPEGPNVIESPTPYAWVIGRIQTNGPDDYASVHKVQDGLSLKALGERPEFVVDPQVDIETAPQALLNKMDAVEFFSTACEVMKSSRPHLTDFSQLARIAPLGIVPGGEFDADGLSPEVLEAVKAGAADGLKEIISAVKTRGDWVNGWGYPDEIGVYGNHYVNRAAVAYAGLGANPAEDAIYPIGGGDADGEPVLGERNYVLRFEADEVPPVDAFWSLTMYDDEGFQVANEIDRFAIGDRDPLVVGDDGSIELYIQHQRPEEAKVANWLPSPAQGQLGLTLRLYSPKEEALDGTWRAPAVKKA